MRKEKIAEVISAPFPPGILWMWGKGRMGGERFADGTPTLILPHPGGGESSVVGFDSATYGPAGLELVVVQTFRQLLMDAIS